ncbi:MAG: hypothetical protein HQL06_11115 [Nitrospirae bacterium]|nr:hypothetical protein [Nitrospirota bacterium]
MNDTVCEERLPKLIEDSFLNCFDIYLFKGRFYAIDNSVVDVDFLSQDLDTRLSSPQGSQGSVVADNLDELRHKAHCLFTERMLRTLSDKQEQSQMDIDDLKNKYNNFREIMKEQLKRGEAAQEAPHPPPPYLFEQDYYGYNIIYYDKKYYAVDKTVGAIDFAKDDLSPLVGKFKCIISRSSTEVKALVERYITLMRNIDERDTIITGLREELKKGLYHNKSVINDLRSQVEEKDSLIKQLQKDLSESKPLAAQFQQNMQESRSTIESLRKGLSEKDTTISKLRETISEKDLIIDNLQQDATDKYLKIVEQQKTLAQKDVVIEGLQQQLNNLKSTNKRP